MDENTRERLEAYVRALAPGCARYWPFEAAGTWAYLLAGLVLEAAERAGAPAVAPADLAELPALVHACPDETPRRVVAHYLAGARATESPMTTLATRFSSEPLDRAGIVGRLRALAAAGVDVSLLRAHMALTPDERIEMMLALADTCRMLQTAMAAALDARG